MRIFRFIKPLGVVGALVGLLALIVPSAGAAVGDDYNRQILRKPGHPDCYVDAAIDGWLRNNVRRGGTPRDADQVDVKIKTRTTRGPCAARVQSDYVRLGVWGAPVLGILESAGPLNSYSTPPPTNLGTIYNDTPYTEPTGEGDDPLYCRYVGATRVSVRWSDNTLTQYLLRTGPIEHALTSSTECLDA